MNCNNTWLNMSFIKDGIVCELGNTVPCPHKHDVKYTLNNQKVYLYWWLIDGFFSTKENSDYLNDIIARFMLTFSDSRYIEHFETKTEKYKPLKLKCFGNLKSIQSISNKKFSRNTINYIDEVFYFLKNYAEELIKRTGFVQYDLLENYAERHFIDHCKDRSTLKAKCRSIYNWYSNRDFKKNSYKIKNQEEVMATRQENARKNTKMIEQKTKIKIYNLLTSIYCDEYKKDDKTWNIYKIAKDSKSSRNTVYKYIKQYEQTTQNKEIAK